MKLWIKWKEQWIFYFIISYIINIISSKYLLVIRDFEHPWSTELYFLQGNNAVKIWWKKWPILDDWWDIMPANANVAAS